MDLTSLHRGETLGAIFIGNTVSAILYGITTVQAYIYYSRYERDSWTMKCLIGYLWVLDTLETIFVSHIAYRYSVIDFTNSTALLEEDWCIPAILLVTCLSDTVIRSLYCYRVWILSERNWALAAAIILSTLTVLVSAFIFSIRNFLSTSFATMREPTSSRFLYVGLSSIVMADVLIASSLCILLIKYRTGLAKTDSIVTTLMIYSVESGILTSVCATSCLIAFVIMPDNYVYIAIFMPLSKFFLNALLATLNARDSLRIGNAGSGIMMLTLNDVTGRCTDIHQSAHVNGSLQFAQIQVDTLIERHPESKV